MTTLSISLHTSANPFYMLVSTRQSSVATSAHLATGKDPEIVYMISLKTGSKHLCPSVEGHVANATARAKLPVRQRDFKVATNAASQALRVGLGERATLDRSGADGVDRARLGDGVGDALLDLRDARDVRGAVRSLVVEERLERRVEFGLREVVRVRGRVEQSGRVVDEVGEEGRGEVAVVLLCDREDRRLRDDGSGGLGDTFLSGGGVAGCREGRLGSAHWISKEGQKVIETHWI